MRYLPVKPSNNVFSLAPRTWIGWLVAVAVGVSALIAAALFVTAALVASLLLAAFLIARAYWLTRKAERDRAKEFLTAEYKVEREEPPGFRRPRS